MRSKDDTSKSPYERYLVLLMAPFFLMPLTAMAQYLPGQGGYNRIVQPGYVCEEADQQGNCVFWREVFYPPVRQRLPSNSAPSYENDYRRPPASSLNIPGDSGLMPSTVYAPGFGTSHPAPKKFGP